MSVALDLARVAASRGEVPVGAIVVHDDRVIARAHNLREAEQDPTAHAELLALQRAARHLGTWRLTDCVVYATLEPCAMCAGALVLARVSGCVFGCRDPKGGFLRSLGDLADHPRLNHRFEVLEGVCADEAADLLRGFFRARRRR